MVFNLKYINCYPQPRVWWWNLKLVTLFKRVLYGLGDLVAGSGRGPGGGIIWFVFCFLYFQFYRLCPSLSIKSRSSFRMSFYQTSLKTSSGYSSREGEQAGAFSLRLPGEHMHIVYNSENLVYRVKALTLSTYNYEIASDLFSFSLFIWGREAIR